MIHDLDRTLEQLLLAQMPRKVNISFAQPTSSESSKFSQTTPTLNLFLFDVRENNVLRQHQWQAANSNGNGNGNGRSHKQRTPYRFDCHYLITAWAKTIDGQHQLLSEAMHILLQHPVLPDDALVGSLQAPQFPIQTKLGSHDKLTNPAELWSALENQIRAAVSYIVTIPLNPWEAVPLDKPVRTKHLSLQQVDQPETAVAHTEIAGQISSKTVLPPNLYVTLANEKWQYRANVDEDGRYRLPSILPDSYTLSAWLPNGPNAARKLGEQPIVVPPPVQVLALADSFQLQIGGALQRDNLHLTPRRAGFVGQANLPGYTVQVSSSQMPRSGLYHFGRRDEAVTAVIPAASQPETSFQLTMQNPAANLGIYDLSIEEQF